MGKRDLPDLPMWSDTFIHTCSARFRQLLSSTAKAEEVAHIHASHRLVQKNHV